jgi:hypothetical protein
VSYQPSSWQSGESPPWQPGHASNTQTGLRRRISPGWIIAMAVVGVLGLGVGTTVALSIMVRIVAGIIQ